MATHTDQLPDIAAPRRSWLRQSPSAHLKSDLPYRFLVFTICCFAFRDTLTSALRYYLYITHLSFLWFLPDILNFAAYIYFVWWVAWRAGSTLGIYLVLMTFFALLIGILVMSSNAFTIFSSIKMFMPYFLGAALAGRSLLESRGTRYFFVFISVLSTIGLLISPYVTFPWMGLTLDNLGQGKEVGIIWWSGGRPRYGGFAGESTIAAFMVVFPYILTHKSFPKLVNFALWIPIWIAVDLSTSKTALGVFYVFAAYYIVTDVLRINTIETARMAAKYSFIAVPIPLIMMLILSGTDLASIDPMLFSMQDRINNTWTFPFLWMSENLPTGLITGCGLGCFTYPMQYTDLASLWVPVDSFYLANLAMMGVPFIIFVFGMFTATIKSKHYDKLLLIVMINIYVVTVQSYGPSAGTIMVAYAFSDMFVKGESKWRRFKPGKKDRPTRPEKPARSAHASLAAAPQR